VALGVEGREVVDPDAVAGDLEAVPVAEFEG
jgi:hypothetical protein